MHRLNIDQYTSAILFNLIFYFKGADLADPESSQLSIYVELRDPDKSQCSEWRRIFSKDENITILCKDFFLSEFDHDAVVSFRKYTLLL